MSDNPMRNTDSQAKIAARRAVRAAADININVLTDNWVRLYLDRARQLVARLEDLQTIIDAERAADSATNG